MLPPPAPRSLCLVRLSALGDVVMVLPLVRWLRRCWPETSLTWICGRGAMPVLESAALTGVELVPIDKPRGLGDYWRLRRTFADRNFDAVLALQASWRANFIYPCLNARRKIGYGPDRAKDGHRWFVGECLPPAKPHLVDGFLQFAEALGLPWPTAVEWGLNVDPEAMPMASRRYMALNVCSSKPERDWLPERYGAVIDYVSRRHGLETVLIGGPSARERVVADEILARVETRGVVDRVGRTNLKQMIALLAQARFLLAPDTGAVHLATALGKPVCGLYAVAPARRTGPYGATEYCVDRFDEGLCKYLGRKPGEVPWAQRVHHPSAMELISVSAVLEKIDLLCGTVDM